MPRYVIFLSLLGLLVVAAGAGVRVGAFPPYALVASALLAFALVVIASLRIDLNFFVKALCKTSGREAVAITFDDGPLPGQTERILDILKANNVRASFFFIGKRVAQHPELVQRTHAEGHVVGGHSFEHAWTFGMKNHRDVAHEITQTAKEIKSTIGVEPRFFRPPFGVTNPAIARAVHQTQVLTIGWSLRSLDTVISKRETLKKRIGHVKPGDIVLFHDYCNLTIDLLPEFIAQVKRRGLHFETLDQFLNEKAYV